jgi:hypothetical protein
MTTPITLPCNESRRSQTTSLGMKYHIINPINFFVFFGKMGNFGHSWRNHFSQKIWTISHNEVLHSKIQEN